MNSQVDFFVVGAQKAGTTALAHSLQQHPELEMSSVKEPHFFDDEAVDWARPDYRQLHAHYDGIPVKLRGEATPIYIYWPPALARLHRYNPAAKLVIALRQPALRAYSHWRMEVSRQLETMSFDDAISESARQRVHRAPMGAHRVFSYIERGHYADQIERVFSLFSPAQAHFLRTDDLWAKPAAVLRKLQDFLGIGHAPNLLATENYIVSVMAAQIGTMTVDARLRLTHHYAGDIRRTAELTGLDLDDWFDENYGEPMAPPAG
jgi:hypothetical protein